MTEVIERNGRLLTIEEFEQEIRADERAKVLDEFIETLCGVDWDLYHNLSEICKAAKEKE